MTAYVALLVGACVLVAAGVVALFAAAITCPDDTSSKLDKIGAALLVAAGLAVVAAGFVR